MNAQPRQPRRGRSADKRTARRTRVVIADAREQVRDALRALLRTWPDVDVVADVGDVGDALSLTIAGLVDTVLMDVLPIASEGVDAVREIKVRRPSTRVVVLTSDPWRRADSLGAGADAFLIKGCAVDELAGAIANRRVPASAGEPNTQEAREDEV